jgi:hypothetical protein
MREIVTVDFRLDSGEQGRFLHRGSDQIRSVEERESDSSRLAIIETRLTKGTAQRAYYGQKIVHSLPKNV